MRSDVVARSLFGLLIVGVVSGANVACSSSSSGADAADASALDASSTTNHADAAATIVHADACQKANAVCAPSGTCAKASGVLAAAANAGGCSVESGAAECCVPPKPTFDPTECNGEGGVCTPFAACDETQGYHSSDPTCGGAGYVCCVPHATCGDATFSCCGESGSVLAPYCNGGVLQCPPQSAQCAGPGDQ